jgi:tetratricopeptide (TPR) repeat protein
MLVQQSGACPGMLRRMIVEYGRALPHTVMQITLEDAYGDTLAMLSTFGRHALHSMALMSPAGSAPAQVSALFGSDTMVGMDELLRHHLLERLPSTDTYRLAAHVRMWILQDYQRGGSASSFIQDSLAMIDVAVSNGKVEAQNTIEYLLSDGEFELAAARRQMWLREGWQRGVQANLWALWLDLLRGATEAAFSTDAMLWLGRGICARWLGLWHESAASLEEAIELSGDTGDFILQAQAIIELSVLKRLLAQYEDIDRDHARVLQAAELFGLYPLVERVQLERVQIAVELGNGGAALQYLRGVPENTRTHLLRAEAHFLVGDLQRSLNESQAAIAAISGDMAALGKANVLLGRVYSAQQDFLTARRHLELAVTLLEQVNDPYGLGRALGNLGALLTDMKLRVLATQTLERAEALQRRLGDRVALFTTQHNLRLLRVDMIQHG